MGWWGHGILASDTASDIDNAIRRRVIDLDTASRQLLNDSLGSIQNLEGFWNSSEGDYRVFLQYLTYQILRVGARLPHDLRALVLRENRLEIKECQSSESVWVKPMSRVRVLETFNAMIEEYPLDPLGGDPQDMSVLDDGETEQATSLTISVPVVVARNGQVSGWVLMNESGKHTEDVGMLFEDIPETIPTRLIHLTAHVNLDELFRHVDVKATVDQG